MKLRFEEGPTEANRQEPDCFLTSGEEVFWSEPRACWRLGVAAGPDSDRSIVVLRIDPVAIGQGFGLGGEDINLIAVTAVDPRGNADVVSSLRGDVHVLLLTAPWRADRTAFGRSDLRLVSRGKLVSSLISARAVDRSMERMNGVRR